MGSDSSPKVATIAPLSLESDGGPGAVPGRSPSCCHHSRRETPMKTIDVEKLTKVYAGYRMLLKAAKAHCKRIVGAKRIGRRRDAETATVTYNSPSIARRVFERLAAVREA